LGLPKDKKWKAIELKNLKKYDMIKKISDKFVPVPGNI